MAQSVILQLLTYVLESIISLFSFGGTWARGRGRVMKTNIKEKYERESHKGEKEREDWENKEKKKRGKGGNNEA